MNAVIFRQDTAKHDWIPDRAIGPTDDDLYEAEKTYHDEELSGVLEKPLDVIQKMPTGEKRDILMRHRKDQLTQLIQAYYRQRGWNDRGIPTVETLKRIGLWDFLNEATRTGILELSGT
jgi:aldehyde:ferredoxin oxidoreductase